MPVYSPITASVVLITCNVPPLTYHCKQGDSQASILHCINTTAIERFQNRSIAVVAYMYTGVSPRAPITLEVGRVCLFTLTSYSSNQHLQLPAHLQFLDMCLDVSLLATVTERNSLQDFVLHRQCKRCLSAMMQCALVHCVQLY